MHKSYEAQFCIIAGQVSFLASMDITTNYLMVRNALYDGDVLAQQPDMALRTYSPSRNVSTLVPFRLYDFDAPSFTFTFRVSNVQVSTHSFPRPHGMPARLRFRMSEIETDA